MARMAWSGVRGVLAAVVALSLVGGSSLALAQDLPARVPVRFTYHDPGAQAVSVVGDFNSWNPKLHHCTVDEEGVWKAEVELRPGRIYEYAFWVDKAIVPDPGNPLRTSSGEFSLLSLKGETDGGNTAFWQGAVGEAVPEMVRRMQQSIRGLTIQMEEQNALLRQYHETLIRKDGQIELLTREVEKLRLQNSSLSRDLATLEVRHDEMKEKYLAVKEDYDGKVARMKQMEEQARLEQARAAELQVRLNKDLQERRTLRDGSQVLEQELAAARLNLGELEAKYLELSRRVSAGEGIEGLEELPPLLADTGGVPEESAGGKQETPFEGQTGSTGLARNGAGQVVVASEKFGMCWIDLGREQGIASGQEMNVFRAGRPISRIRVQHLEDNMSSAVVIQGEKRLAEGDQVRYVGDANRSGG